MAELTGVQPTCPWQGLPAQPQNSSLDVTGAHDATTDAAGNQSATG